MFFKYMDEKKIKAFELLVDTLGKLVEAQKKSGFNESFKKLMRSLESNKRKTISLKKNN